MGEVQTKKREANLELLRILAMLMVVTLHCLGKGGATTPYANGVTPNFLIAWGLEALGIVAVNIYVLLSGYFLVTAQFRIEKCLKLWLQIFFYSAGIWVLFSLLGRVPGDLQNSYYKFMVFAPITSQHYWFATTYFIFYCISPFLALLARKMSKKQLLTCIVVLMLFFSNVWRALLPMSSPVDDRGYGIAWFVCLFFVAAYLRLYAPKEGKAWKYFLMYVAAAAAIFLSMLLIGQIAVSTGRFEKFISIFYDYNSPLTIIAAIALFLAFRYVKISGKILTNVIIKIAGLTFGVYLLHEHLLLRSLWVDFWKINTFVESPWFLPVCIGVVLAVFAAGCLIEWLRQLLFNLVYKCKPYRAVMKRISKIDLRFNGALEESNEDKR